MNILSARKKATEQTQAQSKVMDEPAAPAQPIPVGQSPRTEGPTQSSPAAQIEKTTAEETAENAPDGEGSPVSDGAAGESQAQVIEMLSFHLGGEEYVLPVDDVREVLKSRELTVVPNSPPYILGLTSIRGTVLPVIDLGKRLGLPPAVRGEKTRIIIISPDDEDAGIMVDRVTGVMRLSPESIRPAPETIEQGAEFLKGIARKDDRLYILLDLHKAVGA